MELIYLYIRKYENIFENIGFNFSSNYVADFKDNCLTIEENKNSIKQYYGENINNVVLFFGKNGVGKSTLLDILGMIRDDRIDDNYTRQESKRKIKSSYFMLYHLYDDYFGFEFVDDSFLKGEERISNVDMMHEKVESALYQLPIGTIFKLENKLFKYCDKIMSQWLRKQDLKRKVEYAYITSDRYNNRISNKYRKSYEDYMIERKYYLEENNYEFLYKYFIYLKEMNDELLPDKRITIKNSIEMDFDRYDRKKEVQDYLEEKKKEIDKLFGLKSNIQIQMEEKFLGIKQKDDRQSIKNIFLHTFYAELIEYYFLVQFVGWSEADGLEIDVETPVPDVNDLGEEINTLSQEEKESYMDGLKHIMNFQNEYAQLLYVIYANTDSEENINLKKVLEYVLNRVVIAAQNTINILDRESVLKMLALIEEFPDDYFKNKKSIDVRCDVAEDKKVTELLRLYDYYYKIRNDEDGSNNIFRILNIEIQKMSEGQRTFLNIISKCVCAIYTIEPGDNLVLLIDEPDRALHPELARHFLDTLIDSINKCQDRQIQIVLTSHSPFIVTDILPENVYALDMDNGRRKIRSNKDTYATNIYYLLMDSFMLENTFGEYSYKQLQYILELLNRPEEIEAEKLEWIKKIIDRIGEKTVKKKMLQLYKKHDDFKSRLIEQLSIETDEEKLRKIKEILEDND